MSSLTEFEAMPLDGLNVRIKELKHEYFDYKSQVASGKEKNTAKLVEFKKQIARAMTAYAQKARAVAL